MSCFFGLYGTHLQPSPLHLGLAGEQNPSPGGEVGLNGAPVQPFSGRYNISNPLLLGFCSNGIHC